MRKLLVKYVILIIITFAISIFIYNYIESFKPIDTEEDSLIVQDKKEKKFLKNTSYTIDNPNIILNPYGNSPLTALIVFETNDLTTPTVTIKGKNDNDITHTFTPSKLHILPIYGLYPNYENKIIIEASEKEKEVTIKTEPLPDYFPKTEKVKPTNDDEFYFTSFTDSKYVAAFDSYGDVRWYSFGYNWDIQRLNNGHVLLGSSKTINKNYSVYLSEMDLLGKEYFEYVVPYGYHHGNIELSNGNLLIITSNGESSSGALDEIDRNTGEIVNHFDLTDLNINSEITSIAFDSKTNSVLMTVKDEDMIISIDYGSLGINFAAGSSNEEYKLKGSNIKKPDFITVDDGKYTFINDDRYLTTFNVNYGTHSYEEIDKIDLGKYSNLSVIDGITIKDNLLEDGEYKLKLSSAIYNVRKMSLYANDLYSLKNGVRLGNLGVSETTSDYPLFNTKSADEIIKKYDIKLYKDVFGLKVSGSFSKKDKVEIILDNVLDKKVFKLNTESSSSRYINEDGIKGKYYIYLNINGKVYKLYKYVVFK